MPRYISITPTFNPISTEEYLRVPMLIAKEFKEEQDRVEDYKDKMSYIRNLMGDSGKEVFEPYDNLMNSISTDTSLRNMVETGQKLRQLYREIGSKADIAKTNRDKYQAMFDKDPTLIGDVGSFMEYYNNPDYKPSMISGSDMQKTISQWAVQKAQQMSPRFKGYLDNNKSQMIYSTGFSNDELNTIIADALSGNPATREGNELGTILANYGYYDANPNMRARLGRFITEGVMPASERVSTMSNPAYLRTSSGVSSVNKKQLEAIKKASGMKSPIAITDINGDTYYYEYNGQSLRIVDENGRPAKEFTDSDGTKYPYSGTPGIFKVTNTPLDPSTIKLEPSGKSVKDSGALISDSSTDLSQENLAALLSSVNAGNTPPGYKIRKYEDLKGRQKDAVLEAYEGLALPDQRYKYTILEKDRKHFIVLFDPTRSEPLPSNPYMSTTSTTTESEDDNKLQVTE